MWLNKDSDTTFSLRVLLTEICTYFNPTGGGGGTQLFCGYVPHRLTKVGSREQVFLEKKGVLGAKIERFCILRAEIWPKRRLEEKKILKIENGGT